MQQTQTKEPRHQAGALVFQQCASHFLRWVPGLVPLAQERSLHSPGTRGFRVPDERAL